MTSTTYTNGHAFLCIHCMWGRCDLNLFDQHVTKLPYLESAILFVKSLVGGVAGLIRGHPKRHYWHTWVRRCHSLTTLCEREVRSVILTLLGMLGMSQEYKHQNERKSWRQKKKKKLSASHLLRFFGQRKIYWEQCIALPVARWLLF